MNAPCRLRVVAAALVIVAAGCGWSSTDSSSLDALDALPDAPTENTTEATEPTPVGASTTTTTPQSDAWKACDDDVAEYAPTASYSPIELESVDDPSATGGYLDELRQRGRITVGVDDNTPGFGYLNLDTGDFEGFEVELAREIARRLFDEDDVELELVPVTTAEKITWVEDGTIDMSINANSMSCSRWERVAFSAEYFTANQEFLVRKGSTIESTADLNGKIVCVTVGSSSLGILEDHVKGAVPVERPQRSNCQFELQQGNVDAYFGHDSFIYGMLKQDPSVEMRDVLDNDEWTVSHYGVAVGKDNIDLVRFVNGVLEDMRADGTMEGLYEELRTELPDLPKEPPFPDPNYERG